MRIAFEPVPDDLAAALAAAAPRLGPYGEVRYLSEVDSTNDAALSLVTAGAPEGTSVLAGAQRRGRGRRGHDWFSPAGAGVYLSPIVRGVAASGAPPLLTLGAGVAVADAVTTATGLSVELKWPNDMVVGRPWRKLGGVLAEAVSSGGRDAAVVVGVGINVNRVVFPDPLHDCASTLEAELGRPVDAVQIVVEVLAGLRRVVDHLRSGQAAIVLERWRVLAASGFGAVVRWQDASGEHRGRARDVADSGALLVETSDGLVAVLAGNVIWEQSRGT